MKDWTLADWLDALQITDADFGVLLVVEGVKSDKNAAIRYIYDVKSPKRRQRISNLSEAYSVIKCLNSVAMDKGLPYISCENLKEHGELFLNNLKICSQKFEDFSQTRLSQICPATQREFNTFGIINKVHPKPPLRLFGRDNDLVRVINSIESSPITVISGLAGNGKTTLAWHSLKHLMTRDSYFQDFDWTTDKRYVVGVDGIPRNTGIQPLNFEIFLKSMIKRFKWDELKGEIDEALLLGCAKRLTETPYLLIVDNLETVEDSEMLVSTLIDLLGYALGKEPVSRAIITSRHRVEQIACRSIALHGIDEAFRIPYLKQVTIDFDLPEIKESHLKSLAAICNGNPLLMQIGLQNHVLNPKAFEGFLNQIQLDSNFLTIFASFFDPIIEDIKVTDIKSFWVLLCAAHLPIINIDELLLYWHHRFGDDFDTEFYRALSILRKKMLIDSQSTNDQEIIMHPFVQTYLRSIKYDEYDPKEIISIVNWERLKQAHHLMRKCKIRDGMKLYRTLLNNDVLRFIYEGWWGISDDPDEPSATWACIYLAEFYLRERIMFDWINLFNVIKPYIDRLSHKTQSRLNSILGWAQYTANTCELEEIVNSQEYLLENYKLDDFEIALHEMLLGYLYRQLRQPEEAFRYGHQSLERLDIHDEPYYSIRARDHLAGSYDVFGIYQTAYYEIAKDLYAETERLVTNLGENAEPEQQNYNLGWHHIKNEDMQIAIRFFEKGRINMQKHGLYFEEKLNEYGLSVAYLKLKDYDKALYFADSALSFFWMGGSIIMARRPINVVSTIMTAVCLYIIASIYKEKGELETALQKAHLAYKWHEKFDNPLQRAHVKRCLGEIYLKMNQLDISQQWFDSAEEDEKLK